MVLMEALESLFGLESFEPSSSDQLSQTASPEGSKFQVEIKKEENNSQVPLSVMLENWLFDENTIQGKDDLTIFSFDETADPF